jgi:two-component system response regulator FixJ
MSNRARASNLSSVPLFAIVDDDKAMREALSELVEVFDFACLTFDGGESFLAAHAPGRFAGLVTDLNLLGESGLQLQQRLKTLDPSLPVIIISAQTDPATRARALASGAMAYLTKPINDQVLLRYLNAALGKGGGASEPD